MSVFDDTRAIPEAQQQRAPREHDLAEWLHQIAGGDQAAFARLYDELSGEIRGLAAAAFRDSRAADSVVAATFLQVWRLASTPDPTSADTRTWVASIASSLITQRQNATQRSSSSGRPAHWPAPWAAMSSTYDDAVGAVLASRLNRRTPRNSAESR
jgi:RNA polymerase sigma-70 factor (ECF subfamily)